MTSTFQRARTPEQRAQRAATILEAARSLLEELPLESVTLDALSRRSGLAPSNVLRYYDSREGVLLALVVDETEHWLADFVAQRAPSPRTTAANRCAAIARTMAATLQAHPRFCELISVQSAVLERNVAVGTVAAFKEKSNAQLERLAERLLAVLPELEGLGSRDVLQLAARSVLVAGALWAQSRSSDIVAQQLGEPANGEALPRFAPAVEQTLLLLLTGALTFATRGS